MPPAQFPRTILVLVVEDDPALREFYRATLTTAGYRVIAVEDGLDALRQIDSGIVPRLLVLDLALPRLSGRDVMKELRANLDTHRIPIVVVTGTDARDLDLAACDCFLPKPVTTDALINAVATCLRQIALLLPSMTALL